jgi:hypothetical protein
MAARPAWEGVPDRLGLLQEESLVFLLYCALWRIRLRTLARDATGLRGLTTSGSPSGQATEAVGLGAHPRVIRPSVVVPTEEMEKTVDDEHRHLGEYVSPFATSLRTRCLHAHHNVSQKVTVETSTLSFTHRERKHIGGRVQTPVPRVEFPNLVVFG